MTITYYRLINTLTGYTTGKYDSYDAADCVRNMLDDWTFWTVEPFTEQI